MEIDPKLYTGKPYDISLLEKCEIRCYEKLDSLGIEYRRVCHEHADTIEACHAIEEILGAPIVKNLFLCNRQKTAFYLLIMPGDKPFKTKFLSAQIGSARLSFADGTDMERYLGTQPGSASVLGLMNDTDIRVKLLIDRAVTKYEYIGCHPCRNTSTLKLKFDDIIEKFLPAVGHDPTYVDLPYVVE